MLVSSNNSYSTCKLVTSNISTSNGIKVIIRERGIDPRKVKASRLWRAVVSDMSLPPPLPPPDVLSPQRQIQLQQVVCIVAVESGSSQFDVDRF